MSFLCRPRRFCWFIILVSCTSLAQQPTAIFTEQCSACHSIGGGAGAGPDLKGVGERRGRAWLIKFIHDPQALIAAKDPTASALQKEFAGMEMPAFPDLTAPQREALLDYIAQQSGSASVPPPAEVKVVADPQAIAAGKQIFLGERRLGRGGAACMSCHTIRGIGGLGGGRLGPDLSLAYERLGKSTGMTGWLGATPTPIMAVTYKRNPLAPEEIAELTAFFQEASASGKANDSAVRYKFLALAAGFTLLGLVLIGGAGRNRLRGVRDRLTPKRGEQ